MSSTTDNDVILGALKLVGKLDCMCFTSWLDFVKKLPTIFAVEVPSSITNVIVSTQQPDDDQQDNIWFKLDNSGSFSGIFAYAMSDWRQIFPPPNALIRMFGNSTLVPDGYLLVDSSNPHFTAAQVTAIQSTWYPAPATAPLFYTIFDVTYEGF